MNSQKPGLLKKIYFLYIVLIFAIPGGILIVCAAFAALLTYDYIACGMDTVYAEGYSKRAFSEVQIGMSTDQATSLLGPPIKSGLWVSEPRWVYFGNGGKAFITRSEHVHIAEGIEKDLIDKLNRWLISYDEFALLCGGETDVKPLRVAGWLYSKHYEENGSYFLKALIIDADAGIVIGKVSEWYWD